MVFCITASSQKPVAAMNLPSRMMFASPCRLCSPASADDSSNLCVYLGLGLVLSVYRFSRELPPKDFRMIGIHVPFER